MIDLKLLKKNIQEVKDRLLSRGYKFDDLKFLDLEEKRASLQANTQELQNKRNQIAKAIGMAKAKGEDTADLMHESNVVNEQLEGDQQYLQTILAMQSKYMAQLPNIPHESVPVGKSEEDNELVLEWGERRNFDFTPLDHIALGEKFNGIDTGLGAKLSGSRFVVMQNEIASLHRALGQFMLDLHIEEHGYQEQYVPYIVNAKALYGSGQLPKFEEDLFKLDDNRDFYLIPTAEVPLTNLFQDVIVSEDELPIKLVAMSPCFRSEAGSYGKDVHGIFRLHQFDKVELVQIVHPEKSYEALEEITAHAQKVLQLLELPYQLKALCTGDMGAHAAKTYDLEVWLPGQNQYREISSCSNTESYQARRMQARYKSPSMKKPSLVHMLNGSGVAMGRALIAILENYQDKDGNIVVPKVLQKYMQGRTILQHKKTK